LRDEGAGTTGDVKAVRAERDATAPAAYNAGDVGVAGGVHRDSAALFVAGAEPAPGPELLAVGGVLHDEDVRAGGAGEDERAEGGRLVEVTSDVGVAGGVHRDPEAFGADAVLVGPGP